MKKLITSVLSGLLGVLMVAGIQTVSLAEPGAGFGMGCPKTRGQAGINCPSASQPFGMTREEIQKIEALDAAFFVSTKEIRREIYEKQARLNAELAVKVPDVKKAKALQKEISDLEAKLALEQIDYIIDLKKINPDAVRGMGGCPGFCPKKGRGGRPCGRSAGW